MAKLVEEKTGIRGIPGTHDYHQEESGSLAEDVVRAGLKFCPHFVRMLRNTQGLEGTNRA